MNQTSLQHIAVSASGQCLVVVSANDDIYAAIDTYEAREGEILEGFRVIKQVVLARVAFRA